MWGQACCRKYLRLSYRIIPTRVGTSGIVALQADDLWDHPHACGDKLFGMPSCVKASGSSPRVWGQVNIFFKLLRRVRIIPTRVGTSFAIDRERRSYENHPHACGDKSPLQQTVIQKPGSSPRVWGQVPKNTLRFPCAGIIPTRVGTRIFKTSADTIKKDHPHACGDKDERSTRRRRK